MTRLDWLFGFLICLALYALAVQVERDVAAARTKAESWDQENLKRHDTGCPTSIYTVIDDELVQCPPYTMRDTP